MIGSKYFLHYDGAVRKLSSSAVIRSRAWRGVSHVHLVALRIDHRVCSEQFVTVAVIGRLADVPVLIDQLKPVEVLRALGICSLIPCQNNCREDDNERRNATHHLWALFFLLYRVVDGMNGESDSIS